MIRGFALGLFLLLPAWPAKALFRVGMEQTFGSLHFRETKVSAEAGEDIRLAPTFNSYRSDDSSGTYRTMSLGLNYRRDEWKWSAVGGLTPQTDKYSNKFFGGSLGWSVPGPPPKRVGDDEDEEFSRSGVEAGFLRIVHTDQTHSTTGSREGPFAESNPATDVVQTDVVGAMSVALPGFSSHLKAVVSGYGGGLGHISQTEARRIVPRGQDFLLRGFPSDTYVAGLELTSLAWGDPYVTLTREEFALNFPDDTSVEFGFETKVKGWSLDLSYEPDFRGGGESSRHYVTFGLARRFGGAASRR